MIAEVIDGAYDTKGKQVSHPRKRRYWWWSPTFAMGRFLTQPLSVKCSNLDDLQHFLKQCRYVSDMEQFGKSDYWMLPAEFEENEERRLRRFCIVDMAPVAGDGIRRTVCGGPCGEIRKRPRMGYFYKGWTNFHRRIFGSTSEQEVSPA